MKPVSRYTAGILLLSAILLNSATLSAKDLYVSLDSTNPSGNFATWETAATDIQAAVDKAAKGDTIYIGPGVHKIPPKPTVYPDNDVENIIYCRQYVNFIGTTGNPDDVILDGEGQYRPVCFRAYTTTDIEPMRLMNLTIRNGLAKTGGGIFALQGHSNRFQDSATPLLEIINCNIVSNTATSSGGGMVCRATAADYPYHSVLVSNSIFQANEIVSPTVNRYSRGPAISTEYKTNCFLRVANSEFIENQALSSGGIYLDTGNLEVENCRFLRNTAHGYYSGDASGGAIRVNNIDAIVDISGSYFSENNALKGGAVYVSTGALNLRNSEFRNNTTEYYDANSGGSGIYLNQDVSLDARNCLFVENSSDRSQGGGISIKSQVLSDKFEIRNCTFWGNQGYALNQRTYSKSPFPDIVFRNSIFYNNTPGDTAKQSITSDTNYWYNAVSTNYFYNCSLSATNLNYYHVYENVIVGDPLFADPENGDFRLRGNSPCVNSGMYEEWMDAARDLDGNPRIISELVDMGAYEYKPRNSLFMVR